MLTTQISDNSMDEAYLEIVEQDGEVKLLCSDGEKEGKKIVVDLFEEGSIDLSIPEEVTCVEVGYLFSSKFPCKINSVFISKNVNKIVSLGNLLETVQKIKVDEDNPIYDSRNNCNAIIETSTNKLIAGCETTEIPDNVVEIGKSAFSDTGITKINLPDGLQKIGNYAFSKCTKLQSLTIPASVSEIGKEIFGSASNITKISVDKNNQKYDSRANCNAIIETATNTLIFGCGKTLVPKDVTKIGDYAFSGCKNLVEIKLPDSVTSIGHWCFRKSSLKSIVIPDSVTEIGDAAFWECRALEKITIPAAKFGSNAFYESGSLSEVYFSDSVKCLDMRQFTNGYPSSCNDVEPFKHLKELRFSASLEKIENLNYFFQDIDTLVFEGRIPETNDSFKVCKIKELIINQSRKHAGKIPADIRDALTKVNGNYIYGTPDLCQEESTIPGYIKATLAKNEELIDINTKYIISVEPCEYLHYKNVGSIIKCAADAGNHVAYEIMVHEPCKMIYEKISKSLEQLGSTVGGIGGLINLIETLYKKRKE